MAFSQYLKRLVYVLYCPQFILHLTHACVQKNLSPTIFYTYFESRFNTFLMEML